ncbi:uncharacterized protein ARMOST_12668 [Armillaria ostoyae]|uniref:Integrase zinc-binding domain-containing protein n=1 Tax=Armillaria ostoyae TaxID=47428 RepID=A0A284RKL9_ARMOS|nr:uncharacterized protein ARMOST_12668 [Armillaria ostoyae]
MANKKTDLLSQRVDYEQGQDDNNKIIILNPKHFQTMIMPTDQEIANSLNYEKGIKEEGGLLCYNKRIYVPHNHAVCGEIIVCSHDHVTAGHPGVEKMKELVLRDYWWPKLKKDVKIYVRACKTCARTKSSTQAR